MTSSPYCPERGDVVWLSFGPRAGREQAGQRPALTLSPESYNRRVGLGIFCPITGQAKGYPFEVALPPEGKVRGVILSDHVKSQDWRARGARFCCRLSPSIVGEVLERLEVLLGSRSS